MKTMEAMRFEANSTVFNKLLKQHRAHIGEIDCSRCHYHKGDNGGGYRFPNRNWKQHRKQQYKAS